MPKLACKSCGREITFDRDGQDPRTDRYCPRCGEEFPPRDEWYAGTAVHSYASNSRPKTMK